MKWPRSKFLTHSNQSKADNRPEVPVEPETPLRTRWILTMCRECKHVEWFGMAIPHLVMSKEPCEQLKRVNRGKGSTKRVTVVDYLRIVMSKPEKHEWVCSHCGASIKKCGVATEPAQILSVTQYAMRYPV